MTRLIDADKLYPDCITKKGTLAISQSQIANAPTVCNDNYAMGYQDGVKKVLSERPHGKWMLSPNWSGYCCSNCGANPLDTNIDTTRVKSKDVLGACPFCRLCGAKMEADNER